MLKEIFLSFCMFLPEVCGVRNSIEIVPTKVIGSGYEASVKKRGVLKQEFKGEVHYSVIIKLSVHNVGEKDLVFRISSIRFHNLKGQIVHLYRNTPAHVLDRDQVVHPHEAMDIDLYLISYDLNDKFKFDGILP